MVKTKHIKTKHIGVSVTWLFTWLLVLALTATGAQAAHHRHHRHQRGPDAPPQIRLDLTPVVVVPYVLPNMAGDPARFNFLRRMNLENGVEVRSTRWIEPGDVTTRNLFILSVTQSLEGGFDSVNLYDKGVLSWGIMQWTAATDSLPPALIYIKRRLIGTGQKRVWDKVFAAQGVDVDRRGLIVYGKPLSTPNDMRLAFRGSVIPGNYDPKVAVYWATVFARAGRQPPVQQFQREYAQRVVDAVLTQPLPNVPYHRAGRDATVAGLTGGDPYAQALVFALWTNNPRHAREYVGDAAQAARVASASDDPSAWPDGAFRRALLRRCQASRFGNWRQRGAVIAARAAVLQTAGPATLSPYERGCQAALAAQKAQLLALAARKPPALLASRHRSARKPAGHAASTQAARLPRN